MKEEIKKQLVEVSTEDCLDQDPEIRGQKFVCLSFISPEDVIRQKETYFFNQFLKHFSKDVNELFDNIKTKFQDDKVIQDMIHNISERHDYIFEDKSLEKEFQFFKESNSETLESDYYSINKFQTSIRGLKVRGVFESIKEAQVRAQAIKKFDKYFDVYIAEVGCWCPWSPNPNDVAEQEYPETQLNTLMKKYKENQDNKETMYLQRKEYMSEQVKQTISIVEEVEQPSGSDSKAIMEGSDPWLEKKEVGENS